MVHAGIQEVLDWKLSDSSFTLLKRGGVHQNKEGYNSEVDIPDWDDHTDSFINKLWVEWMMMIVVGCIYVSILL